MIDELMLMDNVLSGDSLAYKKLLDSVYPRLQKLLLAYAPDGQHALDEAVNSGIARAAAFDGEKSFFAWMADYALVAYRGPQPSSDKHLTVDHGLALGDLVGYCLNEVTPATRRGVERHLADCPSCAAERDRVQKALT